MCFNKYIIALIETFFMEISIIGLELSAFKYFKLKLILFSIMYLSFSNVKIDFIILIADSFFLVIFSTTFSYCLNFELYFHPALVTLFSHARAEWNHPLNKLIYLCILYNYFINVCSKSHLIF